MWKCVAQELQYAMRRAGQNPTDVEVRDGLNFLFKSICQHLDLGERDNSAFSPFFFANATSCVCNLWITRWITCFSKLDSFRIHSSQCKLIDSGSFAGSRYDQQDWRWLRHARLQGNFFCIFFTFPSPGLLLRHQGEDKGDGHRDTFQGSHYFSFSFQYRKMWLENDVPPKTNRDLNLNVWNGCQDTFRVFSKDDEGCIPADEMKFVLKHLPGKVCGIVSYRNTEYRNTEGKVTRKSGISMQINAGLGLWQCPGIQQLIF